MHHRAHLGSVDEAAESMPFPHWVFGQCVTPPASCRTTDVLRDKFGVHRDIWPMMAYTAMSHACEACRAPLGVSKNASHTDACQLMVCSAEA